MSQLIPVAAAPVLTSATPADNTGAVSASANIVLNFSAAVHAGSGYITISDGAMQTYMGRDGLLHTRMVGATDTRTFSISDTSQVTISGTQVTINPTADLKAGLSYSVQMGSGVLLGESGLSYAGLLDATKLNFSAVGTPVTPVAPSAVVDSLSMYSWSYETPFITNIANQHFNGTVSALLGSGEKVQVSIDGATWHDATMDGGSWAYDSTISASGTLRARVTGSTGLSSEITSHEFTYDIAAPSILSMTLGKAALSAGESSTLTVVFSEKVSGLTLAAFGAHNSTLSGLEASADGRTWTATVTMGTEGLPGGDVTLMSGAVRDVAGNLGTGSATASYTRGAVSLAGLTVALTSASDTGQSQVDHLTSDTTPTVHLGIKDVAGLATGDRIGIYDLDSNALLGSYTLTDSDVGAYGGGVDITVGAMGDGVHQLVARATDAAGNIGTPTSTPLVLTIDTATPGISGTSPSGSGAAETGLKTIAISFDEDIDWASGNGIIIDSAEQQLLDLTFETPPPANPEDPSHSYLSYDEGTRVLTIHLKDALASGASYQVRANSEPIVDMAGNAYAGSATLLSFRIADGEVTIPDTTAPEAGIDGVNSFSHASGSVTGSYTGTLLSGEHIEYAVNGGDWRQASADAGSWTASDLTLESASSALAVRVADSAGNVADNYFFPGSTGAVYFGSSGDGEFTAGGGKVLLAGAGDDVVALAGANTGYIDGGAGYDTLELNASLNLTTSAGLFLNFEKLVLADNTTLTIGGFSNMERMNLPSSIVAGYTTLTIEGDDSSQVDLAGSAAWHEVNQLNAGLLGLLDLGELLTGHAIYVNTSAHLILLVGDATVHMPPTV